MNDLPPAHLVHLFRSVPTADTEVMRAAQNGLQIADNVNDVFGETLAAVRSEFEKYKENSAKGIELGERRLQSAELWQANVRTISAMTSTLQVEVNATSLAEEQKVMENDIDDVDHE